MTAADDGTRFVVYCEKCTAQLFALAIEADGSVSATCDGCGILTLLQQRPGWTKSMRLRAAERPRPTRRRKP